VPTHHKLPDITSRYSEDTAFVFEIGELSAHYLSKIPSHRRSSLRSCSGKQNDTMIILPENVVSNNKSHSSGPFIAQSGNQIQ